MSRSRLNKFIRDRWKKIENRAGERIHTIILDLSLVPFIDLESRVNLLSLEKIYNGRDVRFLIIQPQNEKVAFSLRQEEKLIEILFESLPEAISFGKKKYEESMLESGNEADGPDMGMGGENSV